MTANIFCAGVGLELFLRKLTNYDPFPLAPDVLAIERGAKPPDLVFAPTLITPEANVGIGTRQLITYGLESHKTLTFSGIGEDEYVVCLQRDLIDLNGRKVYRQEFTVPKVTNGGITLAASALLMMLGKAAYITESFENIAPAGFAEIVRIY